MRGSSGGGVFTLKSFHSSSAPPPDINAFNCPHCNCKVDKERTYEVRYQQLLPYFKGYEGVPPVFMEYYPKISVSDYKLIKKDAQFLERKGRVCDSCYIEFTQSSPGTGAKVQPHTKPVSSSRSELSRSLSSSSRMSHSSSPPSPLSRSSDSSSIRLSNGSVQSSPPASPLFSNSPKAPPIYKSPNPTKTKSSRPLTNEYSYSSNSSNNSNNSSNNSLNHSTKKSPPQNGKYQEAYYLNLYEELDTLRREVHDMKVNEESSVEDLSRKIKEREEELRVQKKAFEGKSKQDNLQKDEQIRDLQGVISRMQQDHPAELKAKEREFERKFEQAKTVFTREKAELEKSISDLKREIEELSHQTQTKTAADRTEMLTEVDGLRQKHEKEKVVEREQQRTKHSAEMDATRKRFENQIAGAKKDVTDAQAALAQEKTAKEKVMEENKELMKQMELLKARLKMAESK